MVHIYLVIFHVGRLGVRMWALFMGRWYLFPFLGVHWDGFLANGPREKHHALQIIGSQNFELRDDGIIKQLHLLLNQTNQPTQQHPTSPLKALLPRRVDDRTTTLKMMTSSAAAPKVYHQQCAM